SRPSSAAWQRAARDAQAETTSRAASTCPCRWARVRARGGWWPSPAGIRATAARRSSSATLSVGSRACDNTQSMHLTELFDQSLVGRANRVALEHEPSPGALETLTFGDLDARANRTAHWLAQHGFV